MKKNKKGFTIVELIIVIAVIGVLAAILIPTFANVIEKANRAAALSDVQGAFTSMDVDLVDEEGIGLIDTLGFCVKGGKVYVFGFRENDGAVIMNHGAGYPYSGSSATDLTDFVTNTILPDLLGNSEISHNAMTDEQINTLIQEMYAATDATGNVDIYSIVDAMEFDARAMTFVWGYSIEVDFGE